MTPDTMQLTTCVRRIGLSLVTKPVPVALVMGLVVPQTAATPAAFLPLRTEAPTAWAAGEASLPFSRALLLYFKDQEKNDAILSL